MHLQIPLASPNNHLEERRVTCWEWKGNARDEGEAAAQWVSELLGEPSRLVRFIGEAARLRAVAQPSSCLQAHEAQKTPRQIPQANADMWCLLAGPR